MLQIRYQGRGHFAKKGVPKPAAGTRVGAQVLREGTPRSKLSCFVEQMSTATERRRDIRRRHTPSECGFTASHSPIVPAGHALKGGVAFQGGEWQILRAARRFGTDKSRHRTESAIGRDRGGTRQEKGSPTFPSRPPRGRAVEPTEPCKGPADSFLCASVW